MQMGDEKREELGRDEVGGAILLELDAALIGRQLEAPAARRLLLAPAKRDEAAGERARRGVVVGGDEHAAGQRLARERRQPEGRICAQLGCLRPVRGQAGNDA